MTAESLRLWALNLSLRHIIAQQFLKLDDQGGACKSSLSSAKVIHCPDSFAAESIGSKKMVSFEPPKRKSKDISLATFLTTHCLRSLVANVASS